MNLISVDLVSKSKLKHSNSLPLIKAESKERIKPLDAFRCIAILMVILYHYTSRYTLTGTNTMYPFIPKSLYPYGDSYETYFHHGNLGVQLFYIISGFVICMTLTKCKSFKEFITKRLLRLFPLLLICSVLTYLIPILLDPAKKYQIFHRPIINFLPSLTFSELWIWDKILHIQNKFQNIEYIDNVYWTLVIEMKFYLLIAATFYISVRKFFRNWLILSLSLVCCYALLTHITGNKVIYNIKMFLETILIAKYILYFTLGTVFYRLYEKLTINTTDYIILFTSSAISIIFFMPVADSICLLLFSLLFLAFIYKPDSISLLSNKFFLFIGMISYPLYLIHENLGILFINYLSDKTGINSIGPLLVTVIGLMFLFSFLLHQYIEAPVGNFTKKYFKRIL